MRFAPAHSIARYAAEHQHPEHCCRYPRELSDAELATYRDAHWKVREISTEDGRDLNSLNFVRCPIQEMRGITTPTTSVYENHIVGVAMHDVTEAYLLAVLSAWEFSLTGKCARMEDLLSLLDGNMNLQLRKEERVARVTKGDRCRYVDPKVVVCRASPSLAASPVVFMTAPMTAVLQSTISPTFGNPVESSFE